MNILTSCSNYIGNYNCDSNTLTKIQSGKGLYFGVCKFDNWYYVLSRNNGKYTSIEVIDHLFQYNFTSHPLPDVSDGHQIICFDKLYVVNTNKNRIDMFNPFYFNKIGEIYPFNINNHLDTHTNNHINSINIYKNYMYIVSHRDENNNSTGPLIKLNIDKNQIIDKASIGLHAHDVFIHNNSIFSTSSHNGELVCFSLDLKEKWRIKLSDSPLLRGIKIDKTNNNIYVGLSQECDRAGRHGDNDAFILRLNENGEKIDTITLKSAGQINDFILC